MGKRDPERFWGRPATKEEVIEALGHPRTWGQFSRDYERDQWLRDATNDLDIEGTKHYLSFLKKQYEKPAAAGTGLISEAEAQEIIESERDIITKEIETYEKRLAELEHMPEEIRLYLNDLERKLSWLKKDLAEELGERDEDFDMLCAEFEGLTVEEWKKGRIEHWESGIKECENEIAKYTALLATLTS